MRELELKFAADHEFVLPIPEVLIGSKAGVGGVRELPTSDLRTTYWDTKDLRLARASVSLRYRRGEDEGPRWTLKLPIPGQAATSRNELHFQGDEDDPPSEATDLLTAYLRSAAVGPVAEINTKRHRLELFDSAGHQLAELDDDVVAVLEGPDLRGRFREIELESRGVDEKRLERVGVALVEAGARRSEPISKVVRALGTRATAPPDVIDVLVAPSDPASQAVRAALASAVSAIIANDARVRLTEADGIHKMRVGLRRLRSNLRTFESLVSSSWAKHLVSNAQKFASSMGAVRDVDVMSARVSELAVGMDEGVGDIAALLSQERGRALDEMLEALRSAEYVAFLDDLVSAVHAPILTSSASGKCEEVLPGIASRAWKDLSKAHRRLINDPRPESFHKVRKKAKQLRYAAEAVAPGLKPKKRRVAIAIANRCKGVQDVLGQSQDAAVLSGWLERLRVETRDQGALFIAGRLAERAEQRAASQRKEFDKVWKSLARETQHKWLKT